LGVDKINQAYHFSNNTELDGALIIATKFSQSAIDLACRINLKCDKRIVLMEREEFDQLDNADQNISQVK
jgi:DNA-binding transcriptional MocR family regulator